MKTLRRVLLDGAMVVLPAGAVVLLVIGIVRRLQDAADPLAGRYVHPLIVAVALLVLLCLLVGLLIRSAAGRRARRMLEAMLFDRIPGYRLVKVFAGEAPLLSGGSRAVRPALARFDDGECPALVMDEFPDGRLLIFLPGSPAPMSGSLHIFTPDRITFLDAPLMPFLKSVASWGLGLKEMMSQPQRAP